MGLANDIGAALYAFSGAISAQSGQKEVPQGVMPLTESNMINEGLLGLAYDVGTAPVGYAKDVSEVPPIQSLTQLQSQPETAE